MQEVESTKLVELASLALGQFSASSSIVFLLDWLKKSDKFKWINANTQTLNRVLAVLGAALAAGGIHFAIDTSQAADGTFVFSLTGFTLSNILVSIFHFGKAFVASMGTQQVIFKLYSMTDKLSEIAKKA